MVFTTNGLLLSQVVLQGMFIAESRKRACTSPLQMRTKPGRQIVTFLVFANITFCVLDIFMAHNLFTHQLHFNSYGFLASGLIFRVSIPLMIFYRFHSAVVLSDIWKNAYITRTTKTTKSVATAAETGVSFT